MEPITVPDIPGPTAQLCWKQTWEGPNAMARCDRRLGHTGRHSWEFEQALARDRLHHLDEPPEQEEARVP